STSFVKSLEQGAKNLLPTGDTETISNSRTEPYTPFNPPKVVSNKRLPAATTGSNSGSSSDIPNNIIPDTLVIPSIGVNTVVRNPTSTNVDDLDQELTKGTVRYPGSGTIGHGNMFIFGHSTGYKVVINKAYKVFNELKNLTKGNEILLQSGSKTYVYVVTSVQKVNKDTTEIIFNAQNSMLTLATCDSFGSKSDRYVVEAVFKGER
ncbi:MAG: sortase, partial [Candidatus Taylorbacteria bacterium]|nr:sortase [Candidatus Taylorbacteria bacterium]